MTADQPLSVDWAVVHTPLPGQTESGDNYVVESFPQGYLMSVIDGLGHGPKASVAARAAVEALKSNPNDSPDALMQRCHRRMTNTRGAVITLASLNTITHSMVWMGVGNVTGVLIQPKLNGKSHREYLLLRGGIVGYRLPPLRSYTQSVRPGDLLILVTDGIRKGFIEDIPATQSPQDIANHIHATHSRGTDDALVLVTRFVPDSRFPEDAG